MCQKCEETKELMNWAAQHMARAMELRDRFSERIDSITSVEAFENLSLSERQDFGTLRQDLLNELSWCAAAIGVVGGYADHEPASVFLGSVAGRLLEAEVEANVLPLSVIRLIARQMGLERDED
jgi:hypothetical protein